jgi:hypothetical protein
MRMNNMLMYYHIDVPHMHYNYDIHVRMVRLSHFLFYVMVLLERLGNQLLLMVVLIAVLLMNSLYWYLQHQQ